MDNCSIHIITLLDEDKLRSGKYLVSIDVVTKKNKDSTFKKRNKKGYVDHKCLGRSAKSPVQEVTIPKNGVAIVKFEVTGALKPQKSFVTGQDTFSFSGKEECNRNITLIPDPDDTTDTAEITFTSGDGEFLHQVVISDVLRINPSMLSTTMPPTSLDCVGGAVRPVSENVVAASGAVRPVSENVVAASGNATSNAQLQAQPMPPRPIDDESVPKSVVASQPKVQPPARPHKPCVEVRPQSTGRGDSGQERTTTPYDYASDYENTTEHSRMLNNSSLDAIANALHPKDINGLMTGLGLQDSVVQQSSKDNHGDCVTATYQMLIRWRNDQTPDSEHKYNQMLEQLRNIGRNDMVGVIRDKGNQRVCLSRKDFHNW